MFRLILYILLISSCTGMKAQENGRDLLSIPGAIDFVVREYKIPEIKNIQETSNNTKTITPGKRWVFSFNSILQKLLR